MFNMKFHSDQRSLDMTRRRRWHRKMIHDQYSNEQVILNTDFLFKIQSKIDQQQTDLTPTKTKDFKINLTAPRMFFTFKSIFYENFKF